MENNYREFNAVNEHSENLFLRIANKQRFYYLPGCIISIEHSCVALLYALPLRSTLKVKLARGNFRSRI